jgi:hypothetical protein
MSFIAWRESDESRLEMEIIIGNGHSFKPAQGGTDLSITSFLQVSRIEWNQLPMPN